MNPLVSVIIPTKVGRERFRELAVACFRSQTYPNKELLIKADTAGIGCGRMRNALCEEARGDIIAHLDDDDWSCPDRLNRQVSDLLSGAEVTGTSTHYCYDLRSGTASLMTHKKPRCCSLAYWRIAWQNHPFPSAKANEDVVFLRGQTGKIRDTQDLTLFVQMVHGGNTVSYSSLHPHPHMVQCVKDIMGPSMAAYDALTLRDARCTLPG